jgi:hypothetical protein
MPPPPKKDVPFNLSLFYLDWLTLIGKQFKLWHKIRFKAKYLHQIKYDSLL